MASDFRGRAARLTGRASYFVGLISVVFLFIAAVAQAASYVYDANGRLRAATTAGGTTSEYLYDALGNLHTVNSVSSGQLAIFSFIPNRGPAGTAVHLYGQGFSATGGANTVAFNGMASTTVTPISASELIATVPAGATNGTLSVTVGTTTVTSTDIFTVTSDSGGQAPTIASFSPTIVAAGTAVTVTGSHFVTSTGATQAGVNDLVSTVTPSSDAQLTFTVPTSVGSGPVSVVTPYGTAQSSQPLVVVPAAAGNIASQVAMAANLTVGGGAQVMNVSSGALYSVVTFQANAGQWLSLQFSQFSSNIGVYVSCYDENGRLVGNDRVGVSTSQLSDHLPQMPRSGTYTVVLQAGAAGQFSVALESNPTISSTSATTLATTVPYQSKRAVVPGLAGQSIGIQIANIATTPSGQNVYATLYDPDFPEGSYLPGLNYSSASFTLNADTKPDTSPDTIVLNAQGQTFSAALTEVIYPPGNTNAALTVDGPTVNVNTGGGKERIGLVFNATAGQNLSLGISNLVTNPNSAINYTVYTPAAGYVDPVNGNHTCTPPGCHWLLTNLPLTGAYTVWFDPPYGGGTMSFTAAVSTDVQTTLAPNVAQALTLGKPGQTAKMTFNGTQGQPVGIYLGNIATAASGHYVYVSTYAPDGTAVSGGAGGFTTNGTVDLPHLPQTGVYTVFIEPSYGDTATMQVKLVAPGGGSTTSPGENAYFTFNGTAGQALSVALENLSTNPVGYANLNIYTPDGGLYVSRSCGAPGCHVALISLPTTGTYVVSVTPNWATQTMTFTMVVPGAATGTLAPNTVHAVSLSSSGQIGLPTFMGTQGQRVGIYVGNIASTPPGDSVYVTTYSPNITMVGGTSAFTTNGMVDLPPLPQTGTYSVLIEPSYSDTATMQVALVTPTALTVGGAAVAAPTTSPGEGAYFAFSGTAGQAATVQLSSLSTTPAGGQPVVLVYAPGAGSYLQTTQCAASGCSVSLSNLPATGTYTVIVNAPAVTSTMGFSISVTSP